MNEQEVNELSMWIEMQPGIVTYDQFVNFLSDYLGCSWAEAEVEMASLASTDDIKVIETEKSDDGRRVFTLPLEELTEQDIRSVFDGPTERDAVDIAKKVHDETGHNVTHVLDYMMEVGEVGGGMFRWSE